MDVMEIFIAAQIALLRTVGVALGTVRISMVVQSKRGLAALVGFFESLLFVVPAAIVFSGLNDPIRMVGYSAGFALGQYVGLTATEWLRVGSATVRIFLPEGPAGLIEALREAGFAATVFDGQGRQGTVRVIHAVLPRRELPAFLRVCGPWRDRCFITVGDVPVTPPRRGGGDSRAGRAWKLLVPSRLDRASRLVAAPVPAFGRMMRSRRR